LAQDLVSVCVCIDKKGGYQISLNYKIRKFFGLAFKIYVFIPVYVILWENNLETLHTV